MGLYNNTAETERLLTENYERYYRLAFKLMRNQDDALDVVQESAYRAIKDCKGVRNKDYLSTWIYRIAYNTAISSVRKKRYEFLAIEETTLENVSEEEITNLFGQTESTEQVQRLEVALEQLLPDERA